MGRKLQTLMNIFLTILPMFCMVFLSVSIVFVTVAFNPDVKWNEYNAEAYEGTGYYAFYYNTLWGSLDAIQYEGKAASGKYYRILNPFADDSWKGEVRFNLIITLGLTSGSLFLLITALTIHAVTQQKLFVAVADFLSAASGFTGGYFCIQAIGDYEAGIINGISTTAAKSPKKGGYYHPEREEMKLGYILAKYSGIITATTCFLILVKIGLYIAYGEGKWIWQRKVNVAPSEDNKTSSVMKPEKNMSSKG